MASKLRRLLFLLSPFAVQQVAATAATDILTSTVVTVVTPTAPWQTNSVGPTPTTSTTSGSQSSSSLVNSAVMTITPTSSSSATMTSISFSTSSPPIAVMQTVTNVDFTSVTSYTSVKGFLPVSVADCWTNPGGVQEEGGTNYLTPGCGAIFDHIMSCFNVEAMKQDIYDNETNANFQACFCGTDATHPYTGQSVLATNFTGCQRCLLIAGASNVNGMFHQGQQITSFCRAEIPFAWLFLKRWIEWFGGINKEASITSMPITSYYAGAGQFTTQPPVVNVAWGASATEGGSLAGVIPELSTLTTTTQTDGLPTTRTITNFVSWVPTKSGSTFDSSAAASSENSADSSAFSTAMCMGRNDCKSSQGTSRRPPWFLLSACPTLALAFGLWSGWEALARFFL